VRIMKCFIFLGASKETASWKVNRLKELKAVFENEEAVRLLDYFQSYKEIVNKNAITHVTK
jgi:hypothetical protein